MWRLLLVVVVGCGRIGFDAAALDGSATADAGDPAPVNAPFGAPVLIPGVATADDEDDPSMTADMLELYFQVTSMPTSNNMVVGCTRTDVSAAWSAPQPIASINTGEANNPKVTADGLAIYFSSKRAPSQLDDLWVVTRPDRASAFGTPQQLPTLNTAENDFEPSPVGDRVLYFSRTNQVSFWRAERATTGDVFTGEQSLPELDTPSYDGGLWVSADELVALFHSDRTLPRTIYRATRASKTAPFGAAVPLTELNMAQKEEDAWLSPDGHTLLFAANPTGQYDLYMATR